MYNSKQTSKQAKNKQIKGLKQILGTCKKTIPNSVSGPQYPFGFDIHPQER
jgi:hypothetical protein